jgi:hypothetical protein
MNQQAHFTKDVSYAGFGKAIVPAKKQGFV